MRELDELIRRMQRKALKLTSLASFTPLSDEEEALWDEIVRLYRSHPQIYQIVVNIESRHEPGKIKMKPNQFVTVLRVMRAYLLQQPPQVEEVEKVELETTKILPMDKLGEILSMSVGDLIRKYGLDVQIGTMARIHGEEKGEGEEEGGKRGRRRRRIL